MNRSDRHGSYIELPIKRQRLTASGISLAAREAIVYIGQTNDPARPARNTRQVTTSQVHPCAIVPETSRPSAQRVTETKPGSPAGPHTGPQGPQSPAPGPVCAQGLIVFAVAEHVTISKDHLDQVYVVRLVKHFFRRMNTLSEYSISQSALRFAQMFSDNVTA